MLKRILTVVFGLPIIIGLVYFMPDYGTLIMVCIITSISAVELCNNTMKTYYMNYIIRILMCATAVIVPITLAFNYVFETFLFLWLEISIIFLIYISGHEKGKSVSLKMFGPVFLGSFFIPLCLYFFILVRSNNYGKVLTFVPMVICFIGDAMAFLFGSKWGKHPLCPKVSPKKTWEGCIGSVVGSVLGMIIFKFVCIYGFEIDPISWGWVIAIGLIGSVFDVLGDLCFSVIKREYKIKDYSSILLGHGGFLDRFDSIIFVTPIVAYILEEIVV